jgi:hypothetical protein
MFGVYEIADITEGAGDEVSIRFEEAFDGVLVIGNADFAVSCGICKADFSRLGDGVKEPKLYTGNGSQKIEGFTLRCGAIIRHNPDADYVRRLGKEISELEERISELEVSNIEIKNSIAQRLEF